MLQRQELRVYLKNGRYHSFNYDDVLKVVRRVPRNKNIPIQADIRKKTTYDFRGIWLSNQGNFIEVVSDYAGFILELDMITTKTQWIRGKSVFVDNQVGRAGVKDMLMIQKRDLIKGFQEYEGKRIKWPTLKQK